MHRSARVHDAQADDRTSGRDECVAPPNMRLKLAAPRFKEKLCLCTLELSAAA